MSQNSHGRQAIEALNALNKATSPSEAMALTAVQTQATLAVAYEQRTANLIALLAAGYQTVQIAGVDYGKLADAIKERLRMS